MFNAKPFWEETYPQFVRCGRAARKICGLGNRGARRGDIPGHYPGNIHHEHAFERIVDRKP